MPTKPRWSMVIALILAGLTGAGGTARAEDVRRFCYTVATVETGQSTYFEPRQQRCDIVWMADKVTIDQPLMSNGGDVVIFADTVHINAPIDTRPYFTTRQVFYDPSPSRTWVEPWSWYRGSLIPAHASLFYWREVYDAQAKLFDFAESKGHWNNPADPRLKTPYSAPQLPAGRTPKFGVGGKVWNIKNGQDAPRPASDARLSGSILIVANRIDFCDKCREPFEPKPLAPGSNGGADDGDTRRRKFLVTSGVKGGLGSPGTQMGCAKYHLCGNKDWDNRGGLNSDGGDAGDIHVMLLDEGIEGDDLVERLSEADAGLPPFAARLRAHSINAMIASKSRDKRSFDRVPEEFPRGAKAGEIRVERNATLEVGLAALQNRLGSWNFVRKYDAKPLVEQIRMNPGAQEVVLPSDMLLRRLLDIRRNQYLAMLERLPKQPQHGVLHVIEAPSPLVRDLSCAPDLRLTLQAPLAHEVASLCRRDRIPYSVFDSDPATVTGTAYDGLALRNRIQKIGDAINQLAFDVKEGVQLLDDANVRADTQLLEARAEALAKKIEELQKAAERDSDPLSSALGAFASEALPGLADGIRLLRAARAQSDPTKADGNYQKATGKFAGIFGAFAKRLGGLLIQSGAGNGQTSEEQQALAEQLSAVLRELAQLQEDAQARRESRLVVLGASAHALMNERRHLLADYRTALDSFEPLQRYVVARSAAQTSGTPLFLGQRANELRTFLASMGTDSLPPGFFGSFPGCSASETETLIVTEQGKTSVADCVRLVNRTGLPVAVEARHPILGTVTLFFLEPDRQKEFSLRTMNFDRDPNRKTIVRIFGDDAPASAEVDEWDLPPDIYKQACQSPAACQMELGPSG